MIPLSEIFDDRGEDGRGIHLRDDDLIDARGQLEGSHLSSYA